MTGRSPAAGGALLRSFQRPRRCGAVAQCIWDGRVPLASRQRISELFYLLIHTPYMVHNYTMYHIFIHAPHYAMYYVLYVHAYIKYT